MKYDTLLIFATKRSGHHAILNWMCEQSSITCNHHNDVNVDELIRGNIKYNGSTSLKVYNKNTDKKINVFNFENGPIDRLDEILSSKIIEGQNVGVIIMLRDFYNTISSSIKSTAESTMTKALNEQYNNWVSYAKLLDSNDSIFINYNEWFTNKDYRSDICETLDINFTDAGFQTVPTFAGGSSFDLMAFQNKGNNMSVLERYKTYENNPLFLEQINRDKISELSEQIFKFKL